jgi:hypothetical protein
MRGAVPTERAKTGPTVVLNSLVLQEAGSEKIIGVKLSVIG